MKQTFNVEIDKINHEITADIIDDQCDQILSINVAGIVFDLENMSCNNATFWMEKIFSDCNIFDIIEDQLIDQQMQDDIGYVDPYVYYGVTRKDFF